MLQTRPHAIHFKRILDFGEGQDSVDPGYAGLAVKDKPPCRRVRSFKLQAVPSVVRVKKSSLG
jgi:hypothetical protein